MYGIKTTNIPLFKTNFAINPVLKYIYTNI